MTIFTSFYTNTMEITHAKREIFSIIYNYSFNNSIKLLNSLLFILLLKIQTLISQIRLTFNSNKIWSVI